MQNACTTLNYAFRNKKHSKNFFHNNNVTKKLIIKEKNNHEQDRIN